MFRPSWKESVLFVSVVTLGVMTRIALQDVPNVAPVAALALWLGCHFSSRTLAVAAPLLVMLISDGWMDHGRYDGRLMLTVYGLLALPAVIGFGVRKRLVGGSSSPITQTMSIVGASLFCSIVFFLGTNTMVWFTSSLYSPDLTGLCHCWGQGLPFFRNTLAGDLGFNGFLFGSLSLARWGQRAMLPSSVRKEILFQ